MKIIKVQALRGPNIWSIQRKKLIQMWMDLEEMEQSTNKIDGFKERIENVTTLIEHRCSEGCRGDFFPEWNAVLGWGM
jgi:cyanophycin synthetase